MNASRKFLKTDMNIQTIMLSAQLLIAVMAFGLGLGWGLILWVPIITFFLGVYQWGISAMVHITGLQYTPESIKKWRRVHVVGSVVYLLAAILVAQGIGTDYAFIIGLVVIPQMIGYAYYGLTIRDYKMYNTYRDNVR